MLSSHPNTKAVLSTGGLGVFVVWLLGYFGVAISAEAGAGIAVGAASVVVYIGRRGIRGTLSAIWRGSSPSESAGVVPGAPLPSELPPPAVGP